MNETGMPSLSPRDTMRRAAALADTLPGGKHRFGNHAARRIDVGIFFDDAGCGQAAEPVDSEVAAPAAAAEPPRRSNILRLFHAHRHDPDDGCFRIYVPGVGMPFAQIGDAGKTGEGEGAVDPGAARIVWALVALVNALHDHVRHRALLPEDEARAIVAKLAGRYTPDWLREAQLHDWQVRIEAALRGRRQQAAPIGPIHLSVFGCGAGAAQARTFVHWLLEGCQQQDGATRFAGLPVRVPFLGLFDTVASTGKTLPAHAIADERPAWAMHTMAVHPAVARCVHYVAGHEVRRGLPLVSVRLHGSCPANDREVVYPGAHGDVCGGYLPGEFGVSARADALLSLMAGAGMYREACAAGVAMQSWGALDAASRANLMPGASLAAAFQGYMAAVGGGGGDGGESEEGEEGEEGDMASQGCEQPDAVHAAHMAAYFSYLFKHRLHPARRPGYAQASERHRACLDATCRAVLLRLAALRSEVSPMARAYDVHQALAHHEASSQAAGLAHADARDARYQQLRAAVRSINPTTLTPAIERFFDAYVHDAVATAMDAGVDEYALDGMGPIKFRRIFDSDGQALPARWQTGQG